ncbi:MAG: hypothetical protein JO332_03280, partial [Planctomycetaceae bacterium]|nr:hypothetical protein [Planctomycetaceae bacterium]
YCFRCSSQLREVQFEQGKAYRVDNWVICAACAPDALLALPAASSKKLLELMSGVREKKTSVPSQRKTGAALPAIRDSSRANLTVTGSSTSTPSVPKKPRNPWILVGAIGAAIVVLLILVLMNRTSPPAADVGGAPPSPPPPVVARPSAPTESPALAALKKAALYEKENPSDLDGQIREYSDLTLLGDRGEAGAEARRKVDALRARDNETVKQGMDALQKEIDGLRTPEQLREALKIVEAAKTRLASTSWKLAVEKLASETRRRIVDAMKPVVAAPPPPPPPPPPAARSAEGKSYDARWEKSIARATARDYAGAAAELKKDLAALKDEDLRREAAQDVADLEELGRVYQSTLAAAAAARSLDLKAASGRVLSVDADRVELFSDPKQPTAFVEWMDVRAESLVPLLKMQATDPRLPALFAILDGDVDAARGTDGIAPKYWALKATPPRAAPEEAVARELYYMAERDWRSMETRARSVEAYKALRTKHKDTSVVKRNQPRIDRRAESGKEYFFLTPDFRYAGTFAPYKEERLESIADSDPAQANRNWAEWDYDPLPGATYRCWVLVGGCCAETFAFSYQATGLTELNPKTKKKVAADPGGDAAVEARPAVKGLKPTHPKTEPKKPARWEWVELPLPKVGAPGARRVRVLTDQRGFAISTVVVSATRTKPPGEAELAELARLRALDATPGWAIDRAGRSPRILIEDFEQEAKSWAYVGGWEFKGAVGSFSTDLATGHDSKGSGRMLGDFSGGGAYIGVWKDLSPLARRDFKEIRFWVKSPTVTGLGVRLADASDQVHQRHVPIPPSPDWQEVVLKPTAIAGGEHWGGANDGAWHGPIKGLGLNIGKGSFTGGAAKGELWIDDVEGLLDPDSDK